MVEFDKSLIQEFPIDKSKRETGGFITDSKTDFVEEGDSLEKHIQLELNAKHPDYKEFAFTLRELLDKGRKSNGLIIFMSGF